MTKARPWEYTTERYEPSDYARASRLRRVLVIVGYALVVLVLLMAALDLWVSESCLYGEVCTPTEELISTVGSAVWLGATATVVALGWRGALPGSRLRKDRRKP